MTQTQQEFLEASERAFVAFVEEHPEFPQLEAYVRQMASELQKAGLSPTNPRHLAQIWKQMRVKSPGVSASPKAESAPRPASEQQADSIESKARQLIADGLTLEKIDAMSTSQLEMFVSSPVGQRAYDILRPPRPAQHRTLGDLAHAEELRQSQHRGEIAAQVQRANAEQAQRSEQNQTHAGKHRAGTHTMPNLLQAIPMPKTSAERIAGQRERQREKDREFVEAADAKSARIRRVQGKPALYR